MSAVGIHKLRCTICGDLQPSGIEIDTTIYPTSDCNIAIQLPCGHWMLDDCADDNQNGTCFQDASFIPGRGVTRTAYYGGILREKLIRIALQKLRTGVFLKIKE